MAMNTLEHSFFHKTNISMIFRVNTKKKPDWYMYSADKILFVVVEIDEI